MYLETMYVYVWKHTMYIYTHTHTADVCYYCNYYYYIIAQKDDIVSVLQKIKLRLGNLRTHSQYRAWIQSRTSWLLLDMVPLIYGLKSQHTYK